MNPRTRMTLLGAALLLAGMVIGAAGGILITRHVVHKAVKNPEQTRAQVIARMKRQLKLDPEQGPLFDEIAAIRGQAFRDIRRSTIPAIRAEFATLDLEMRELLNDEQEKTWEQQYARLQKLIPAAN